MVICYVHAFCHTIRIFQVQLFHLYRAYKGYMGVTYQRAHNENSGLFCARLFEQLK